MVVLEVVKQGHYETKQDEIHVRGNVAGVLFCWT